MKNTLSYTTILSTIQYLKQEGELHLSKKLENILENNEIEKPEKHNKKNDLTTSYFRIEISKDELEEIRELISNSLAISFDKNSEPTSKSYKFEDLLSDWANISGVAASL